MTKKENPPFPHREYRVTCVTINPITDLWCKTTGIKPTFIVNNAKDWFERLNDQTKELHDLRVLKESNERTIFRLQCENIDLLRFRQKILEKMKKGEKFSE